MPISMFKSLPSVTNPVRHPQLCAPASATAQQPHNVVGPLRPRASLPARDSSAPASCTHGSENGVGGSGSRSRREVLLSCASWPLVLASITGSNDATTIINSVLGGYFLPQLPNSQGFKLLDEIEDDFTLEYPRAWVSRPNSLRSGLYISDFNTADKLTVEILKLPPGADEKEIKRLAVVSTIVPGFLQGQQDDKLELPARRLIKSFPKTVEGQAYTYLEFPSETTTRSGYDILRRNFAVAAVKRGNLYVCAASSLGDQFNKDKEVLLRHVVESFRLR